MHALPQNGQKPFPCMICGPCLLRMPSVAGGSELNTPWSDVIYISAHNVSCTASTAMARFQLNARTNALGGQDISFVYGCQQAAAGVITGAVTSYESNWTSLPAFLTLDPLNLACPKPNQAVQAWWFGSRGSIVINPEARISYKCVEFNTTLSCAQRTTDWKAFTPGDFTALQFHDIRCGSLGGAVPHSHIVCCACLVSDSDLHLVPNGRSKQTTSAW